MLHARPARVRARRRMTGIAMTTVSLFALSACGGDPEAQETVGPTAGGDPSSTAQAYEPTLPPYTSDVDLTDEETEQLEDTLLAINEYIFYTSATTDESSAGINRLFDEKKISEGMRDAYHELKDDAEDDGKALTGQLNITDMAVWEYTPDEFGYFGFCLEYQDWGLVDQTTGLSDDGETPPATKLQLAELQAFFDEGDPVLQNLRFDVPENECKNL